MQSVMTRRQAGELVREAREVLSRAVGGNLSPVDLASAVRKVKGADGFRVYSQPGPARQAVQVAASNLGADW